MRFAVWLVVALTALGQDAPPAPLNRTIDPAGPRWQMLADYDASDSTISFRAIQAGSSICVVAFATAASAKNPRPRGVAVRSGNGGETWETVELKEIPRSGFLLTGRLGWMVTDGGIWRTGDCGQTWEKIWGQTGLNAVWFLDEARGFAVGSQKRAFVTENGGRDWTKIDAADKLPGLPDRSYLASIEFAGSEFGIMSGANVPRRNDLGPEPDWLDPEAAMRRRQLPNLMLSLQTVNGGKSWLPSSASILGTPSRIRLRPNGSGLVLVEFFFAFDWPAEIYRMDLSTNTTTRVFREKDRAVTDIAILANGISYAAGIEPPGTLRGAPVPGRVRIAGSTDQLHWREMAVDYRAVARRVMLATRPEGPVYAATDTGMILGLRR